jgi:hypothetical protein
VDRPPGALKQHSGKFDIEHGLARLADTIRQFRRLSCDPSGNGFIVMGRKFLLACLIAISIGAAVGFAMPSDAGAATVQTR